MLSAQSIDKAFLPVKEWDTPRFAIMGGISDCSIEKPYYSQYLQYLETLSRIIKVQYFTNTDCQNYIKTQIDVTNIEFINYSLNSIWIRDYAPIWLKNNLDNSYALANFPYGANFFGKQEQDDQFSSFLSKHLDIPLVLDFPRKQPQFYFDGGNLLVDEKNICYTAIKEDDFPPEMRKELLSQINCFDVVILEPIPEEKTGHVDVFLKLLPNKKAILAKYTTSPFKETMERNKKILIEQGLEIFEIPHFDLADQTNWSYVNSIIVNEYAFVPQYGLKSYDENATKVFRNLGFKVMPIYTDKIMQERGALHCITNFIF